ncbi:MAG: VIT domain-containing protein, partial [Sneathiella sp.]
MKITYQEQFDLGLLNDVLPADHPVLKGWPRLIRLLICLNLIGLLGIWVGNAHAESRGAELMMIPMTSSENTEVSPQLAFITATKVNTVITGHIVRSQVVQTFENPTDQWMEGKYFFPLPDGASVDRMILKIGDRRIVSEIQEKQKAKKIYEEAAAAGKISALLDQYRPNVFSTAIANIEPGAKISVEISFQLLAEQNGASFKWIMPLAITPRYSPKDTTESKREAEFAARELIDVQGPLEFSVLLKQGDQLALLESPSHDVKMHSLENGDVQLSMPEQMTPSNNDFILDWKFEQSSIAKALLFEEKNGADSYLLGILLPPSKVTEVQYSPRDVTFILDISGSMQGVAIDQGKAALIAALGNLRPTDRFEVMAFNDSFYQLFGNSRLATGSNVDRAKQYVQDLEADRGTEMYPALKRALLMASAQNTGRQIVFLTDGAVENEAQMFELVDRNLGDARLFTIGLGQAPNSWFMRKSAEIGRGIHIQVDDVNSAKIALDELFTDMARPTLQKIQLSMGASSDTYPRLIPDLYGQRPIVFLSHRTDGNIPPTLKALDSRGDVFQLDMPAAQSLESASISKLWASKKIEGLMDAATRGMDRDIVRTGVLSVA